MVSPSENDPSSDEAAAEAERRRRPGRMQQVQRHRDQALPNHELGRVQIVVIKLNAVIGSVGRTTNPPGVIRGTTDASSCSSLSSSAGGGIVGTSVRSRCATGCHGHVNWGCRCVVRAEESPEVVLEACYGWGKVHSSMDSAPSAR